VTHWTRVLYYDYFRRNAGEAAGPQEVTMERSDGNFDGLVRVRSPLGAAAVLLGIYVTMYLAVGGLLYMFHSPDSGARIAPEPAVAVASCT
jgi:hypothetical protein